MASRIVSQRIFDCTYRNANRNYSSKKLRNSKDLAEERRYLGSLLYSVALTDGYDGDQPSHDRRGEIYIKYGQRGYTPGKGFTAGSATQNYLTSGSRVPTVNAPASYDYDYWFQNRENSIYFLNSYQLFHKNDPNRFHARLELNADAIGEKLPFTMETADALAGTIAHEILHNVGWDHTNNDPSSYPGTVIKEFGNCLARNGADPQPQASTSFSLEGEDDTTELTTEDVLRLSY
jgi:hypothetical protein